MTFLKAEVICSLLWVHYALDLLPAKRKIHENATLLRYFQILPRLKDKIAFRDAWVHLLVHRLITSNQFTPLLSDEHVAQTIISDFLLRGLEVDHFKKVDFLDQSQHEILFAQTMYPFERRFGRNFYSQHIGASIAGNPSRYRITRHRRTLCCRVWKVHTETRAWSNVQPRYEQRDRVGEERRCRVSIRNRLDYMYFSYYVFGYLLFLSRDYSIIFFGKELKECNKVFL